MAEAMISALIGAKVVGPHEVFASDKSADRRRLLKQKHGVNTYSTNLVVAGDSPIVVLAVKPQNLDGVLAEIAHVITGEHLVVSIAAGKRLEYLQSGLPSARLVRVMPNMAVVVREGMSAFCAGQTATQADRQVVARLFSCFGRAVELPEDLFDTVTALSGSGPAFFAYLLQEMVNAAVGGGLSRTDALLLAEQTMLGTSRVLLEQSMDPAALISAVASPGGTTEAGLEVLKKTDIGRILSQTIVAAAKRSRELSK